MMLPKRALDPRPNILSLTCSRWPSLVRSLEALGAAIAFGIFLNDASAAPQPHSLRDRIGERGKREEQEKQISKRIPVFSDEQWQQIVGDKSELKFPVAKGNTLYGISKELFGDAHYWPKIWALNNGAILNPHVIRPGQVVAFMAGTTSSLPGVTVIDAGKANGPTETPADAPQEQSAPDAPPATDPSESGDRVSQEWRKLPPQQQWESEPLTPETIQAALKLEEKKKPVAPMGADRMRSWPDRGIQLESVPMTDQMESVATITGSRSEGLLLGKGDLVYIEADAELTIGETYSVTRKEPGLIKSRKSDRSGWSHENTGTVRILSLKEGLYIGQVLEGFAEIQRGDLLVPYINKAFAKKPIPGPAPIEATLLLLRSNSLYASAQHKQVFIDRGREDGVQPGMIFRSYQYWDPGTGERFTDSDFIIDSDILVIHSTEEFSVGIVLSSLSPVVEGSTLVLLTDISDVLTKNGYRTRTEEEIKRDSELDELDRLPPAATLEEEERKELEQLEKWKKNPEGTEGVTDGSTELEDLSETPESAPEDLAPPPPPTEELDEVPPSSEEPPPPVEEGSTSEELPPPAEEGSSSEEPPPPPLEDTGAAPSESAPVEEELE